MKYLVLLFSLFLFSCTSGGVSKPSPILVTEQKIERRQDEVETKVEGQTVEGMGYQITYPTDWDLMPNFMGTDTLARSLPSYVGDPFLENINVVFEATSTKDSNTYYKNNLPSMKKSLPKFTIISEKKLELSGFAAIDIIYTHEAQNLPARNRAIFIYKNGVGYVITTTSTPETFEEYYRIFDQIIRTFRFN